MMTTTTMIMMMVMMMMMMANYADERCNDEECLDCDM